MDVYILTEDRLSLILLTQDIILHTVKNFKKSYKMEYGSTTIVLGISITQNVATKLMTDTHNVTYTWIRINFSINKLKEKYNTC